MLINLEFYQNQIKGNLQEKQPPMVTMKINYPMDNNYQMKSLPVVALGLKSIFVYKSDLLKQIVISTYKTADKRKVISIN